MVEIDVIELARRAMELAGLRGGRATNGVEHRDQAGLAVGPHLLESHPTETFVRSSSGDDQSPAWTEGRLGRQHAVGATLS